MKRKRRPTLLRKPKKKRIVLVCCVCTNSNNDPDSNLVPIPNPIDKCQPLSLNQIDASWFNDGIVPDNAIFLSCCGNTHAICGECLHNIATNYESHPVNETCALIPCMTFEGDCTNENGFPHYFNHDDVEKLLNPEEKIIYRTYVKRYRFPGFEIVNCPRPKGLRNNMVCGAEILVSIQEIRNRNRGRVLLECSQGCHQKSCYYCYRQVRRQLDHCTHCVRTNERLDPQAFNHYFYKRDKEVYDEQPLFYRNCELDLDLVRTQLHEIIQDNSGYVRCFNCSTKLHKTEQCNALSHCRIEICYACGRSGTPTEPLTSHWDRMGLTGCPRFDHHNFWNEVARCDFRCQEGECHSQNMGDCQVTEHQVGIRNMTNIRKKARVYHALFSLLPETLEQIKPSLETDEIIQPYMPLVWGNDYREYLPELPQPEPDPDSDSEEIHLIEIPEHFSD